jgi:hypothetical protein
LKRCAEIVTTERFVLMPLEFGTHLAPSKTRTISIAGRLMGRQSRKTATTEH